ncbi:hypothetical protein TCEL_00124 [Thermobrachium celere DSM 8682]|uniref:Uncharacterized protein n=1 Tax=Thermobrachium celere DSM 8682 TaxID=941824 RepID=R7RMG1_9CLOT|nr:hypothetical protein TCEL_00124 [Thermobrachium celere DSM 8682]
MSWHYHNFLSNLIIAYLHEYLRDLKKIEDVNKKFKNSKHKIIVDFR